MPEGPDDGFSCKYSSSPEGNIWISVFRRQIMKKKGLKLGLEGWAGREKSCAFPPKGVDLYCWETTAWVETKCLAGTLRIMPE